MPQPATGNIGRISPIAEHVSKRPCSKTKADPTEPRMRQKCEDTDLEQKVMEGDNDPMRVKVIPPTEVSGGVEVSTAQEAKNTRVLSLQNRMIQL